MPVAERIIWYIFFIFLLAVVFFNPAKFLGPYEFIAKKENKLACVEHLGTGTQHRFSPSITSCPTGEDKLSIRGPDHALHRPFITENFSDWGDIKALETYHFRIWGKFIGTERRDLSFTALALKAPELAERFWLIRDRVRDLRMEHRHHRKWMRAAIKNINFVILCLGLAVIWFPDWSSIFRPLKASKADNAEEGVFGILQNLTANILGNKAVFPGLVGLLIVAFSSFSYSSKYAAIFAAESHLKGLESRIDAESANLFYQYHFKEYNFTDQQWEKVNETVSKWGASLEQIEMEFGKQFGATSTTIALPDALGI